MKTIMAKKGVRIPKLSQTFKAGEAIELTNELASELLETGLFMEGGVPAKKKTEKKLEKKATSFDKQAFDELRAKTKGEVKEIE